MSLPAELRQFIEKNERPFASTIARVNTAQEILTQSGIPFLPILGIEVPHAEMLAEAMKLERLAVPHRSKFEEHRGWKSLVLHGISTVHTQGAEHYGLDPEDPSIYHWTDIARLCPITTEFFKTRMHYEHFQRVRFMYLEPGGFVLPHRDTERYFLGPTNLALNHPHGCRFLMENVGVVPFAPGQMNKLALINRHSVVNESQEVRVHIIVHGAPDWRHWDQIYKNSYRRLLDESPAARVLGH